MTRMYRELGGKLENWKSIGHVFIHDDHMHMEFKGGQRFETLMEDRLHYFFYFRLTSHRIGKSTIIKVLEKLVVTGERRKTGWKRHEGKKEDGSADLGGLRCEKVGRQAMGVGERGSVLFKKDVIDSKDTSLSLLYPPALGTIPIGY
uniref:Uncharacterized protein n=1 Tax=Vitis vinifera TaxID=29760 RepID=F6GZ67_VITVI